MHSSNLEIQRKNGGASLASQVVTEVDHTSEAILLHNLIPLAERLNLGILTEERIDNGSRLEKSNFLAIDPLDGTLPYSQGEKGYCVSIGLVNQSGQSQMGVIYDPANSNLYQAIKGQGALKNGKVWRVLSKPNIAFRFILDHSSLNNAEFLRLQKKLKKVLRENGFKIVDDLVLGGAAMNAIWCIEDAPACYIKAPKRDLGGGSIWDFAASSCILTEASAYVCAFDGSPLNLNDPKTTFMNHQGCLIASHKKCFNLILRETSMLNCQKNN